MDNGVNNIRLEGRKRLFAGGVNEVISFDEYSVILDTVEGQLNIGGEDLHVKALCLEKGDVTVEGRIDELVYEDVGRSEKRSIFGRRLK